MLNLTRIAGQFRPQGLVLLGGILLACWLCGLGVPVPRWDDGIYKSPGAELAQHGRLIVPAATGFLPQADRVFAAYPPLYQLAIAGWYRAFGVSLRSSLAFSFTMHLLGVWAVMAVAGRLARATLGCNRPAPIPPAATIVVVAVGLIHLANLAHFDRPEEMALLWIWLELVAVHPAATRPGPLRAMASGLLVGLAALTAPWVGMVGALVVGLRALFTALQSDDPGRRARSVAMFAHLAIAAVTAATIAGSWYAAMELTFPGAVRAQMNATLGFLKGTQFGVGAWEKLAAFRGTLFDNRLQLPAAIVATVFVAAAARARAQRIPPLGWAMYLAGAIGLVAVALLRPAAYTYFGAALIVLLPCLGVALVGDLCGPGPRRRLALAALLACTAAAYGETGRLALLGQWSPESQTPDHMFAQLREAIPPGQSVAATSTHWLAFQGRNPWREVLFAAGDPREVVQCQWLVLPYGVGQPDFIDRFERVAPAAPQPAQQNYGYSLWRRREKKG